MQNGSESSTGKDALYSEERTLPAGEQGHPERRSSRKLLVAGCILVLIIGLMLIACVGLAVGVFAAASITAAQNQDEWLALADDFMQAMADKEIDKAYSMFADVANSDFKPADLSALVEGPFYALFDGYADLGFESWYIDYGNPEGISVEISGPVYYLNEYEGIYVFVMTKEGGNWKLLYFNVEVPPGKINSYTASSS